MEYPFFPTTAGSPYHFVGGLPTANYANPSNEKLASSDLIDPAFIHSYDAYQYSANAMPAGSAIARSPGQPPMSSSVDSGLGLEPPMDGMTMDGSEHFPRDQQQRSSSEEKDSLTPAQSRRKAQNRAAQRAFRERKERHVKELEAKLASLETSASTLASDNERLKLALQRAASENALLRRSRSNAGSPSHPSSPSTLPGQATTSSSTDQQGLDPLRPEPLYTTPPPISDMDREREDSLLPASAAWDFIMAHPLVRSGQVDVADVVHQLRGTARCDGQGPAFSEKEVRRAVESARRGGGDSLLA